MDLQKIHTQILTKDDIEKLYPMVNQPKDWQIDVGSHELIDKIIELWFETQGYDFWNNPYPDVTEWIKTKDNEIIFKYMKNG